MKVKTYLLLGAVLGAGAAIAERPVNGVVLEEGSTWCCESVAYDEESGYSASVGSTETSDTVWTVDTVRTTQKSTGKKTVVRKPGTSGK
ncbi:hypothetical protein R80B4_01606 [Fibrobacteres bacterium R8-0-B4]